MKFWLLLFGILSCLSFTAQADDTPLPDAIPTKLTIYIGGFLGPRYSVELQNDVLIYRYSRDSQHKDLKRIVIKPDKKAWSHFIEEINAAKLYRWSSFYQNPGVNDGTQWGIKLEINGRKIETAGDNNYPTNGNEAMPTKSADPSPPFNRFCLAVSNLTGQTIY